MISPNLVGDSIQQINLNRETFCQDCEVGILIKNCRDCLFNALCDYEPHSPYGLGD